MSALNSIPPTPAAASKKTGNGGWNVEDTDSSPAHSLSSPHPAQSEIFQLVMDQLPVLFSGARPPAKSQTGKDGQPEAGSQNPEDLRFTNDDLRAHDPSESQSKIVNRKSQIVNLMPASDGLIPPANIALPACVAETILTPPTSGTPARRGPIVSTEKSGDFPANSPANLKTESSGVIAVDSGRAKTNAGLHRAVARQPMSVDGFVPAKAGLTPATPVLSRILNPNSETGMGGTGDPPVPDGHWPGGTGRTLMSETGAQKNVAAFPVPSGGSPLGTERWPVLPNGMADPTSDFGLNETDTRPASSFAPAKTCVDLPEALLPVASGAPGTVPARSASEDSPSEPAPGVPLTSPEDSENEAAAAVSGGKMPEIQKEPATIEHLRVTNDDLRAADPSPSQSQIPNRISQIVNTTDGTTVAHQDTTMKMAAKMTNLSEAKQKLPGATAVATGENLPGHSKHDAAPATIIIRVDPALPSGDGTSTNAGAAKAILPGTVNLIQIPSTVPQYVERTREMISLQVIYAQETGAEEMRVVIKPDNGLQLSLHLQQRDGGVEVQAVLERGNFGLLNRHWPELQQQLELRGVRVAPLANAEQSFGGGSEGFRQPTTSHGQHAGDDADPAEMPAVLLPGLPPATATASASTISSRRLETWA